MKYRPEIDGLRAIAVVPVILFHAGFPVFKGGYVGVDIFFVISGFLITSIILNELETRSFSFVRFYERRARRIIPMVFLICLVSVLFGSIVFQRTEMEYLATSVIAVMLFSSNILFWNESGYWDLSSEFKPLLHTWSLAVEEQFYLLFPILLIILYRINRKLTLSFLLLSTLLSLSLAQFLSSKTPEANFYLLPSRAWELAIGAIIGLVSVQFNSHYSRFTSKKTVNELLSILGLLLIASSILLFDSSTPFPSLYALVPTLGTALILIFSATSSFVRRLLSSKPFTLIGLISYSLYLWHQPILAYMKYLIYPEPSELQLLFAILLMFPLSFLTWKYVENPFRNKRNISRKLIFKITLIGSLVFLVFGSGGLLTHGYPSRPVVRNLHIKNYEPDNKALLDSSWAHLRELSKDESYGRLNNPFDNELWFELNDKRPKILIFGNSHSKDVYNVLNSSSYINNFQFARYGIQIRSLSNTADEFYHSPNYNEADVIMLASRYNKVDLNEIDKIFSQFEADNKIIVIVESIYEFEEFGTNTTADFYIQKFDFDDNDINEVKDIVNKIGNVYFEQYSNGPTLPRNAIIRKLNAENKNVIVLDRMHYICNEPDQTCFAINDDLEKYFYDYGHHTIEGARFFGSRIDLIQWLAPIEKSLTEKIRRESERAKIQKKSKGN